MNDHRMDCQVTTEAETVSRAGMEATQGTVLLLLLSAVYGIQYLNQILLGLFVQPIKADLALSDTQVGLLTGVAFSLFYVVLGFPLARLADKRNRKVIVVTSVVLFSAATAACGFAMGFISLFIARICVAVGEAGTMPSAVSMLADRFSPAGRRLAMAIHSSGGFLGTAIGLLALSAFSAEVSWRWIFWSAGAAGLALAVMTAIWGHEPLREARPAANRNFLADMGALARNVPFVLITLGLGVASVSSSAAINWAPAFLYRSFGLPQPEIVLFLSFAWGIGATLGSVIFGVITNRLNREGGHRPLFIMSVLTLAFPLIFILAFSIGLLSLSMASIVVAFFVMSGVRGPAFATIQDIVPGNLQATANAAVMFSMYAFGVTVGPLATGMISDALKSYAGTDALRYALTFVMAIGAAGGACLFGLAAIKFKPNKSVQAKKGGTDAF